MYNCMLPHKSAIAVQMSDSLSHFNILDLVFSNRPWEWANNVELSVDALNVHLKVNLQPHATIFERSLNKTISAYLLLSKNQ